MNYKIIPPSSALFCCFFDPYSNFKPLIFLISSFFSFLIPIWVHTINDKSYAKEKFQISKTLIDFFSIKMFTPSCETSATSFPCIVIEIHVYLHVTCLPTIVIVLKSHYHLPKSPLQLGSVHIYVCIAFNRQWDDCIYQY